RLPRAPHRGVGHGESERRATTGRGAAILALITRLAQPSDGVAASALEELGHGEEALGGRGGRTRVHALSQLGQSLRRAIFERLRQGNRKSAVGFSPHGLGGDGETSRLFGANACGYVEIEVL